MKRLSYSQERKLRK